MIRDLTELAVTMVKAEMAAAVRERAEGLAEDRLLDLLLPRRPGEAFVSGTLEEVSPDASRDATRDKLRAQLRSGKLDERPIEMDVQAQAGPMFEVFPGQGMEEIGINLKDMLSNLMPGRTRRRRVKIGEARRLLVQEEAQKLVDVDEAVGQAIRRVEDSGIVFLDELDKIAGREGGRGPTCRGRACSGTSCRSWRGRPSPPSTGWSGPITSCSSRRGPSTWPSRPT